MPVQLDDGQLTSKSLGSVIGKCAPCRLIQPGLTTDIDHLRKAVWIHLNRVWSQKTLLLVTVRAKNYRTSWPVMTFTCR